MNVATFTRQRVRIERRFAAGAKRGRAMDHMVRDAGAVLVIVDRKLVAWRLHDGTMVCVKRRYPNHAAATQDMERIRSGSAESHLPARVYQCEACNGFHTTSQAKKRSV